jgi:transposase
VEISLEELEATAAEADAAAEVAAGNMETTERSARRLPARRPLPDHLPRQRVIYPAPTACPCCGGTTLSRLGEDVTESLERIPERWVAIQHVREKVSCRSCETISQASTPFHPIARGRAGPGLLAEIAFAKLALPLHRPSRSFAREGVALDASTLADWIGAVAEALRPLVEAIELHFRNAGRKFFELADLKKAPMAIAAMKRIDALFEQEPSQQGGDRRRPVNRKSSCLTPAQVGLSGDYPLCTSVLSRSSPKAESLSTVRIKTISVYTFFATANIPTCLDHPGSIKISLYTRQLSMNEAT